MKTSPSYSSPVRGSCSLTRPRPSYPISSSSSQMCSIEVPRNMVPSPRSPLWTQSVLSSISQIMPTVMRDGIACGLTTMSGVTPSSV